MADSSDSSIVAFSNNLLPWVGPGYRDKHWPCNGCNDPGGHFADHPAPCPTWVPQKTGSSWIYPMVKREHDALISESKVRVARSCLTAAD
jgi:hypothetical protein